MNGDFFGLILAAGKGSRMRPFAPKEMLPFVNKSIVGHAVSSLKSLGVEHFNVVVGEGKYNIQEHLGNGGVFGVNISYDFQHVLDGDAGGIRCANTTKFSNAKYVFVLFGDTVFSDFGDLAALQRDFLSRVNDPSYVGAMSFRQHEPVIPEGSSRFPYGVAKLRDSFVEALFEKPSASELSEFVVDGVVPSIAPAYVFKKDYLFRLIDDLYASDVSGEYHLSDAIKLALSKGLKFSGYAIRGKSMDMGRPLPYLRACRDWFTQASDEDIEDAAREWESLAARFKEMM